MPWRAALLLALAAGACDAQVVQAVGDPGGAFGTGRGCNAAELESAGPPRCPSGAQLGFDRLGDDGAVEIAVGNLTGKQVSCRRSFCGAGSLVMHAEYTWRLGEAPPGPDKLGEIHYRLPRTTELYGKTLGYALYLDGPSTPVNAYIAVTDQGDRFRMVNDLPVYQFRQWTTRGGTVNGDNEFLHLPPGTTSLLADEIIIAVYLATEVRSGDNEHWSADLYVDEISW
jgi:hypothetical protein